jgi:hypothetical protein
MPPSHSEIDRQGVHKSYHLRSSKWNLSIFSSELLSIREVCFVLYEIAELITDFGFQTACQAEALSVDIKQLRKVGTHH